MRECKCLGISWTVGTWVLGGFHILLGLRFSSETRRAEYTVWVRNRERILGSLVEGVGRETCVCYFFSSGLSASCLFTLLFLHHCQLWSHSFSDHYPGRRSTITTAWSSIVSDAHDLSSPKYHPTASKPERRQSETRGRRASIASLWSSNTHTAAGTEQHGWRVWFKRGSVNSSSGGEGKDGVDAE